MKFFVLEKNIFDHVRKCIIEDTNSLTEYARETNQNYDDDIKLNGKLLERIDDDMYEDIGEFDKVMFSFNPEEIERLNRFIHEAYAKIIYISDEEYEDIISKYGEEKLTEISQEVIKGKIEVILNSTNEYYKTIVRLFEEKVKPENFTLE